MRELMGATIEVAPPAFRIAEPVLDSLLPAGTGRIVADSRYAIVEAADVGTFAVAGGSRVFVDPAPTAEEGAVSAWLHGTVAALLLAQRGQFALHASVVEIDGVGVAVAGPRRVGKSTTALRLAQLGHPLVTDDVSPLTIRDVVMVHPFARPVYVLAETAETLGLDVADARPVLPEHPKLALAAVSGEPVRLGAVAALEARGAAAGVHAVPRAGAQAHWSVALNVYRRDLLREVWEREMFVWAGRVAQEVAVYAVTRPADGWTADVVARAVERIAVSRSRTAP